MQTERFEMRLDHGTLDQLDQWRASQPDQPSRAEAVRRFVHGGLAASGDEEVRFSPGEKLILIMLCDLARARAVEGDIDPTFVSEAISGGHYWALDCHYPGIFGARADDPEVVREVVDVLEMWIRLENGYGKLGEGDKGQVASEAEPFGSNVKFGGFDANVEPRHYSIARFLIERLKRFREFEQRELNSHFPVVDGYRRMLRVYQPIRQGLVDRDLSISEIVTVLRGRIHPENQKA